MAPKNRPSPLSDGSLLGPSANWPVKNTFIDVPLASADGLGKNNGVIQTAPPVVDGSFITSKMRGIMSRPSMSSAFNSSTLGSGLSGLSGISGGPLWSPLPTGDSSFGQPLGSKNDAHDTPRRGLLFTPLQTPSPAGFKPSNWPLIRFPTLQENVALMPESQLSTQEGQDLYPEDSGSSGDDTEYEYDPEQANMPLPSRGSVGHFQGTCKRCCFFPRGRCMNGQDCEFCHFDHEKRKRKNKKKKKHLKDGKPPLVGDHQSKHLELVLADPRLKSHDQIPWREWHEFRDNVRV